MAALLIQEPSGLCIGKILLVGDREVLGLLGEPYRCEGQTEITQYGGWRSYKGS